MYVVTVVCITVNSMLYGFFPIEYSCGGALVASPAGQSRSAPQTPSTKTQDLQISGGHQTSAEREEHGADSNANC